MSIKFDGYALIGDRKIQAVFPDRMLWIYMQIQKGEFLEHLFKGRIEDIRRKVVTNRRIAS